LMANRQCAQQTRIGNGKSASVNQSQKLLDNAQLFCNPVR